MRKKIVWWLYIIYFLIIGVNAFGVHDNPLTNHDLASIGLKSPNGQYYYGSGGIRLYHEYKPNIVGFLFWTGAGAMVAYMLQGNDRKKDEDVSENEKAGY